MAPCNCGQKAAKSFKVTLPNGKVKIVNSEPQARAEISKAGGGKYVVNKN